MPSDMSNCSSVRHTLQQPFDESLDPDEADNPPTNPTFLQPQGLPCPSQTWFAPLAPSRSAPNLGRTDDPAVEITDFDPGLAYGTSLWNDSLSESHGLPQTSPPYYVSALPSRETVVGTPQAPASESSDGFNNAGESYPPPSTNPASTQPFSLQPSAVSQHHATTVTIDNRRYMQISRSERAQRITANKVSCNTCGKTFSRDW